MFWTDFRDILFFVSLNCWFIEFIIDMFCLTLRTDDRKKTSVFCFTILKKIDYVCMKCVVHKIVPLCLALTTVSVWVSQ